MSRDSGFAIRDSVAEALARAKAPCITSSFQAECVVLTHMARSKPDSVRWSYGCDVGQLAVVEPKHLERAWILSRRARRFIASRHQHDSIVGRQDADIVRVNTNIERTRLRNLRTHRSVGVDRMNRNAARVVVGHQQVARGSIAGDVDGT